MSYQMPLGASGNEAKGSWNIGLKLLREFYSLEETGSFGLSIDCRGLCFQAYSVRLHAAARNPIDFPGSFPTSL